MGWIREEEDGVEPAAAGVMSSGQTGENGLLLRESAWQTKAAITLCNSMQNASTHTRGAAANWDAQDS